MQNPAKSYPHSWVQRRSHVCIKLESVDQRQLIWKKKRPDFLSWAAVVKRWWWRKRSKEEKKKKKNKDCEEREEEEEKEEQSSGWFNETAWSQPPFRSSVHRGHIFPSFLLIRTPFFSLWLPAFMFQKGRTPWQTCVDRSFCSVDDLCAKVLFEREIFRVSCYRSVHVQ